jgi:hypothetical protein
MANGGRQMARNQGVSVLRVAVIGMRAGRRTALVLSPLTGLNLVWG